MTNTLSIVCILFTDCCNSDTNTHVNSLTEFRLVLVICLLGSLDECLRAYTEPEFLTGSNVVECENCHRINLERLAGGARFEEVFPGVKVEAQKQPPAGNDSSSNNKKSKYVNNGNKKQTKKRQSRQAKLKSKLGQSSDEVVPQDNCDVGGTGSSTPSSSMAIVEDHFNSGQRNQPTSGAGGSGEEDAKSSKSGSLDDYVVIQSTQMIVKKSNKPAAGPTEMDLDCDDSPSLTGDNNHLTSASGPVGSANYNDGNDGSNLSHGLSTSLKSLSLTENVMEVEDGGGNNDIVVTESGNLVPEVDNEEEFMIGNAIENEDDELMDDLDEPAVDGVGNASDIEDDEGNGMNPLPLDLEFLESKPPCITDFLSVPASVATTTSSTIADEGFSEGENSSEEKNSQSLSGSSSRNSISEADGAAGDAPIAHPNDPPVKKIPVTKCPCSRQQLISRPPECLTLHLKRFQHTARGSSKLSDTVTFPYILNMTKFCSQVGEDMSRPGYKSIFDEDGEVVYALYGIVEHSGSLHFGHYVAYVKVPGKTKESGDIAVGEDKWFYISDSHVSASSLKNVLSQDAYILFYERIRGAEKRARWSEFQGLNSTSNTSQNSSDWANDWSTPATETPTNVGSIMAMYSVDKPLTATVVEGPQWDNWEEDSNSVSKSSAEQVTSSTDPVEVGAPSSSSDSDNVSSSNSTQLDILKLGVRSGADGEVVSSSTDNGSSTLVDSSAMDYSASCSASRGARYVPPPPLWDIEPLALEDVIPMESSSNPTISN
jgi:hypothetical protein